LFSSLQQSTLNNRTGQPSRVPPPVADFAATLDPYQRAVIDDALGAAVVGGPQTVRQGLDNIVAQTGADELMVTANIYDHEKRKRSFAIIAEVTGMIAPGDR
ncbi:MAG TPA: alkane 1-monooxygenase, partial [Stellaceae bacterium]|nr:alkane 1-monooxygenase [Stellaceae bacterium]